MAGLRSIEAAPSPSLVYLLCHPTLSVQRSPRLYPLTRCPILSLSPRRNRWEPEVCAGLASILGKPLGEPRPCFCLSGLSSRVAPSHKCQGVLGRLHPTQPPRNPGVREPQRPGSLAPFPRAGRRLPDLPSSMEGCEPELGWGRRRFADREGSWGAASRACRRGLSTQARRGLAT